MRELGRKGAGGAASALQEALKRGSAFAWKGRWTEAIAEYSLALKHSPRDPSVRTYLAMALHKSGQKQKALDLYQELWKEQPSNPSLLHKVAEIQAGMGDLESAVASYRDLAGIYTQRGAPRDAFQAWKMVAALKPDDLSLWDSVLEAGIRAGTAGEVMPAYLRLARAMALEGRFEEAVEVVERGQKADPGNPLVLPLLAAIRGALAYSWRARALGNTATPEELAKLIPEVSSLVDPALLEPSRPPVPFPMQDRGSDREEPSVATVAEPARAEAEPSAGVPEPAVVPEQTAVAAWTSPVDDRSSARAAEEDQPASESRDEPPRAATPQGLTEVVTVREGESAAEAAPQELRLPAATTPSGAPIPDASAPSIEGDEGGLPTPAELSVGEEGIGGGEPGAELPEETPLPEPEESPRPADGGEPAEPVEPTGGPAQPVEQPAGSDGAPEPVALPATASAPAIAEQLAELGEARELSRQMEQAATAYGQALGLVPGLPRALLGMARLHLAAGELEPAEGKARQILEDPNAGDDPAREGAVRLILDLLARRAASGDALSAAEGLLRLLAALPAGSPPSGLERGGTILSELLGECGAEHLEELGQLPEALRGQTALALKEIEEQLRDGALRSAMDGVYRLIVSQPDFLPAQSLLVRALAALGRLKAARERSRRLVELYDMRGTPAHALDILKWRVAEGNGDGDDRPRLVQLLRAQDRFAEAEAVEAEGRRDEGG